MRKNIIVGLVGALLIGGVIALVLVQRGWWQRLQRSQPDFANRSTGPAALQPEWPSVPDVFLQINGNREPVVPQGAPLILSVRLANQRAMNAALQNKSNQAQLREIEAKTTGGKISKQEADAIMAGLRHEVSVPLVRLADDQTGLEQFLSFELRLPDGKRQPLPWPVKLKVGSAKKEVVLDARATAELTYALDLSSAAHVAPGQYQVVAMLEVARDAKVPDDRWRGRVESEPVNLTIQQKSSPMSREDQEKTFLALAHYYLNTGEFQLALDAARDAVALSPHSIPGYVFVGRSEEQLGHPLDALAAFQTALREFHNQHPHSYEAPLYLNHKVENLSKKMRAKP